MTKANTRCDWVYFQIYQLCYISFWFLFKAPVNGLVYNNSNLICLNVFFDYFEYYDLIRSATLLFLLRFVQTICAANAETRLWHKMPIRKSCVPISICFGFFRKNLTLVQQSFRSQRKLFPDPLQYLATRSVHHLADEHGRASTQSAICLLVFVL